MSFTFKKAGVATLVSSIAIGVPLSAQTVTSMKEVLVTANGFADPSQNLPFGVSVISAEEIDRAGAVSVSDALIRLLGVTGRLDTSGGGNHQVDLRGFGQASDSNQLVVVDGRRLNAQDMGGSHLDDVPIESVQRIEVIHGGSSVLYGEGATGGVILITTKSGMGLERKNSATLSETVGSNVLRASRVNATMVSGGFSVDVFGSDQKTDGHRENFASVNNALGATAQWTNDWLRVGVQSSRSQMFSGLPGGLTKVQYEENSRQALNPLDFGKMSNESTSAFLESAFGEWKLSADVGERTRSTYARYISYSYDSASSLKDSTNSIRARHDRQGEHVSNALTMGMESDQWTSVGYNSGAVDSLAYYVNDDVTLNSLKTRVSVGLRKDNIKKSKLGSDVVDEAQNAWHVGVTQPIFSGMSIFGRAGKSYRLPNIDEIPATGSPSLQTQTSKDLEIGLRSPYAQGQFEVRVYRHQLTNEIGQAPWPLNNANYDPTLRQGIELEARHELSKTLSTRVNASVRESKFVDGPNTGKDIAMAPKQTLSLGMNWEPAAQHRLYADMNWVASQMPGDGMTNDCSMPAYSTINARYSYTYRFAEFALGVSNLADSKYYTQAYTCSPGNVTDGIYPEPGRVVNASLKLKF
jgi:iron complex outermembrane receptor protein